MVVSETRGIPTYLKKIRIVSKNLRFRKTQNFLKIASGKIFLLQNFPKIILKFIVILWNLSWSRRNSFSKFPRHFSGNFFLYFLSNFFPYPNYFQTCLKFSKNYSSFFWKFPRIFLKFARLSKNLADIEHIFDFWIKNSVGVMDFSVFSPFLIIVNIYLRVRCNATPVTPNIPIFNPHRAILFSFFKLQVANENTTALYSRVEIPISKYIYGTSRGSASGLILTSFSKIFNISGFFAV